MVETVTDIGVVAFPKLVAGDKHVLARLDKGERLCIVTPLRYPGRKGPILVHLIPETSGDAAGRGPRAVRISDAGGLVRCLEEQGLDLSVNVIVSQTVFHAVRETEGAHIGGGELYIESSTEDVVADLWSFLQLMLELIGLRHSKYKDALMQLSKRADTSPDPLLWEERAR